jgi:two-component system, cell cycle sensor histidine kinase and response regulator CckA
MSFMTLPGKHESSVTPTAPAVPSRLRMMPRAWRIAGIYAVFATLWICFSDRALRMFIYDPELLLRSGTYKGVAFVVVTSILLLLLMNRAFRQIDASYVSLVKKEAERQAHEAEIIRMNRLYAALSQVNQAIVWTKSKPELLEKICQVLVEFGGFRMAWIGWHNPENHRLEPAASWGDENGYLNRILISADDGPEGCGPSGTSFREDRTCVCNDILNDPMMVRWREEASRRGFRACAMFPVRIDGLPCAVMNVYGGEPGFFQDKEIELLEEAAMDVSFALENHARAEEYKRTEAIALRERQFSDMMIESMPGILYFYDETGKFLRWNRNFEKVSGYSSGEIATMHPLDFFASEDKRPLEDRIAEVFDKGESFVEAPFLSKNGSTTPYFFTGRLVMFDGKRCLVGVGIDISDQKKADAIVREQASLLDKAQDAIIVRGLDHQILFWNRSAERLYGWSKAQAVGQSIKELLYSDPAAFLAATAIAIEKGEWIGEIEQFNRKGDVIVVEGRWSLVRDDEGRPQSILDINTDITERKKLERQFLRAQRIESIGTLAGGISHDLNNVLAPIMMSIELLKKHIVDPSGLEILDMVDASARRGADMVSQVLSFARGVEGSAVELQVSHIIRDLVRIVSETFPKDIITEWSCDSELWLIKGDPTQIHQVLLNLCLNARDAMPDGGRITLRAQNLMIDDYFAGMNIDAKAGAYIKIDVEDTGQGIPIENIDKLFDPFFTTKEVGKGTGLGLSTSLAIIKGHGGFIQASSDSGRGAHFQIYLPAMANGGIDVPEAPVLTNLPYGDGETVLVVDDEASIRQVTRHTLEAFGYQVLLATNGSEAIAVYREFQDQIAVVLTDMMMPVMDGTSAVREIRRLNPAVRVIGVSGIKSEIGLPETPDAGPCDFLSKPYTAEVLLKAIKRVIKD